MDRRAALMGRSKAALVDETCSEQGSCWSDGVGDGKRCAGDCHEDRLVVWATEDSEFLVRIACWVQCFFVEGHVEEELREQRCRETDVACPKELARG